jgi:PDZ domain-containing protein
MESSAPLARPVRPALAALGLLFILVPVTVAGAYLLPSPVALVVPGPVEPAESLITIDGRSYEPQGRLLLTGVRLYPDPRLGQYVLAHLQPDVELVRKEEARPPFLSREEFRRLSQRLVVESQNVAQVVALRQAGYQVSTGDSKVEVLFTLPGTPASEQLQPGDVIEAANGEPLRTTTELVSIVQGCLTGEPVDLRVRRDQRRMTVTLPALLGPLDAEGPVLGIVAMTRGLDYRAPVNVRLDSGPVAGGASAGLMYALGVYNALATEDITRGHRIAGTGTLRLNGKVGPAGAIRLKVRAAEDAGAQHFLVAVEDAPAARAAARHIRIIPVSSFEEALSALRALDNPPPRGPGVVPAGGDTMLARSRGGLTHGEASARNG